MTGLGPAGRVSAGLGLALVLAAGSSARGQDLESARRLVDAGRVAEAIPYLERARTADPGNPLPLWMLAVAHLRVGNAEDAASLAAEFSERMPDSPNGPLLQASALQGLGRPAEAETALREALAREPRHPEARRDLAVLLMQRGETDEALNQLEALAAEFPGRAEALAPLGVLYVQLDRTADGLEALIAAAQADPSSFEAQHHLGALWSELGQYAQAGPRIEAALALRPGDPGALLEMCRLRSREERLEDARRACAEAAAAAPEDPEARFASGDVLHYLAESEAAEAAYRAALRLDPAHDRARYRLGQLLHETGRSAEAVEVLLPAVDRSEPATDPGRRAEALMILGQAITESGDRDAAIARLEAGTRLAPTLPEPHLHLGNLLVRSEDPDAVERGRGHLARFTELKRFEDRANELRAAVNRAPGAREPKGLLIAHLIEGGAVSDALEESGRLFALAPAEPLHHRLYADALEAAGRLDDARSILEGALDTWPDNADLREASARMAERR